MTTLCLSAAVAQGAAAEDFHAERAPVILSGGQTTPHKFTFDVGSVFCANASFSGDSAWTTASSISLHPEYGSCELSSVGIEVSVDTSETNYEFLAPGGGVGDVNLIGAIVISGPGCTINVPGLQYLLGPVIYTNEGSGSGRRLLVTAQIPGEISYSWSGFLCGSGSDTNGTYTGSTLYSGATNLGDPDGIWVE